MEEKNNLKVSKKDISEFKNLAIHNKSDVMFKKMRIKFDGVEYDFIIKGVGQKAVKLELYCNYESILANKDNGIIESKLHDKLSAIYEKGVEVKSSDEVSAQMLLNEFLLTDIIEVSETELKYKVMDLKSYETFYIWDKYEKKPNYQFIKNILLDNAIMPIKNDVKTFQRIVRNSPLYFNAVYLKYVDDQISLHNAIEDFAIIPNAEARGFARCKEQLQYICMSIEELKGKY